MSEIGFCHICEEWVDLTSVKEIFPAGPRSRSVPYRLTQSSPVDNEEKGHNHPRELNGKHSFGSTR
jgi:hypothetical protein